MENMMKEKMFNFEDLRLYQKVLDFIGLAYSVSATFPDSARTLAEDFRRTAEKIALYIAEGSGENKPQFISLLRNSKACVRICLVYATIAYRRGYLTQDQETEIREKLIELAKMLGGLITSLQNRLRGNRPHHHHHHHDPNMYNSPNTYNPSTGSSETV